MISILSLGHARFAALLAWLALASMGLVQPPATAQPVVGTAELVAKRLVVDTPVQANRLVTVKLSASQRAIAAEQDGPLPGPGPAIHSAAFVFRGPFAERASLMAQGAATGFGRALAPYAARAPPVITI